MSVWAIVPVKPLRRGKSRLSSVLTVNERAQLNRAFLLHTLEVLKQTAALEQVLVVSRDTAALALARKMGVRTLQEKGDSQLNLALRRATVLLQTYRVSSVLVLPADLPLLTPDDVQAVLAKGQQPPVVVLAPDRHQDATNALLVSPPGLVPYCHGPGSFARYLAAAQKAGARVEIVKRPGLALDVDWPEDLHLLRQHALSAEWLPPAVHNPISPRTR